jgi:hypothetical protein
MSNGLEDLFARKPVFQEPKKELFRRPRWIWTCKKCDAKHIFRTEHRCKDDAINHMIDEGHQFDHRQIERVPA